MYNTGNPIGSTAPKDFSDNSEITDRYVNDVVNETTLDRFGRSRLTIHGIQKKADEVITNLGFFPPVDYTPGLNVDSRNFTVTYNGIIYAAQPSAVPFTTGAWDAAQWYPIQNNNEFNQLLVFESYSEAISAASVLPDFVNIFCPDENNIPSLFKTASGSLTFVDFKTVLIHLEDYQNLREYAGNTKSVFLRKEKISGIFSLDASDFTSTDDGGIVIVDNLGRRWKRNRGSIIERFWFEDEAGFNIYSAQNPNFDHNEKLDVIIQGDNIPLSERLKNIKSFQAVVAGPRDALLYRGPTSVTITRRHAAMGGFRYRGQYTKGVAPHFPMPTSTEATCSPEGLGAESNFCTENWYAAFAAANTDDLTATVKTMPFLRVNSVSGNTVTLNRAGEGVSDPIVQSYSWNSENNLTGVECLVISASGAWSGDVAKILGNTSTSITLDSSYNLGFGDFLLPAPPGFEHFVYLCSFYMDTAEVRNIYDSGVAAQGKMIYLLHPDVSTGSIPFPGATLNCAGYISPLATAVILDSSCQLATASTGGYAEYFDPDGANHIIRSDFVEKTSNTSLNVAFSGVHIPFLYYQSFSFYNAGSLANTRYIGQLNVTGWIEP